MNKILVGLTTAALLALIAAPALATGCFGPWCVPQTSNDVTVINSSNANVTNNVIVVASTGDNEISRGKGGVIITGAATAIANVQNNTNYNKTKIYAPCTNCNGDVTVTNLSSASVTNNVKVIADTGDNEIKGGKTFGFGWGGGSTGGTIITGAAGAQATVVSITNSNITRIVR